MLPNSNLISCNFSSIPSLSIKALNPRISYHSPPKTKTPHPRVSFLRTLNSNISLKPCYLSPTLSLIERKNLLLICKSSLDNNGKDSSGLLFEDRSSEENKVGNGNGGNGGDWTTSILLFGLWAVLMYYVFMLTPDQTPSRDMYFLQKLLNLERDDGFEMNEVLVSLWYIMGLWPLIYSMLLLPSGRSSKSKIPVWPFLVLSCFGGAYALLPYFVLWRPPSPPVEEAELARWPLNFMESKIAAGILAAAGLGLVAYAGLASGEVWTEFYQYFRESKFIHITCIDFTLLSAFAPFWVYNDMTARKWFDKGFWLLPLSLVPFLGPVLYVVLRPPLPVVPVTIASTTTDGD